MKITLEYEVKIKTMRSYTNIRASIWYRKIKIGALPDAKALPDALVVSFIVSIL